MTENGFVLTNTGEINIEYEVCMCENFPSQSISNLVLSPNWLAVQPRNGIIKPNECVEFELFYFSGIPGEFRRQFVLSVR